MSWSLRHQVALNILVWRLNLVFSIWALIFWLLHSNNLVFAILLSLRRIVVLLCILFINLRLYTSSKGITIFSTGTALKDVLFRLIFFHRVQICPIIDFSYCELAYLLLKFVLLEFMYYLFRLIVSRMNYWSKTILSRLL